MEASDTSGQDPQEQSNDGAQDPQEQSNDGAQVSQETPQDDSQLTTPQADQPIPPEDERNGQPQETQPPADAVVQQDESPDQPSPSQYKPKRLELENAGLDQDAAEAERQAELARTREVHNARTAGESVSPVERTDVPQDEA